MTQKKKIAADVPETTVKRFHMHLSELENGVKFCALRNAHGIAYKVPVDEIQAFLGNQQECFSNYDKRRTSLCIDKACVYIIFGSSNENAGRSAVYIGETENIGQRLVSHGMLKKGEYNWDEIIIFCRTDYDFSKGYVNYVERHLMLLANMRTDIILASNVGTLDKDGNITPRNRANLKRNNLRDADKDVADDFIASVQVLTKALGYDIFMSPCKNTSATACEPNWDVFDMASGREEIARAQAVKDGLIVLRGSKIKDGGVCSPRYKCIRDVLKKWGVIVDEEFLQDYKFGNAAMAAGVILGSGTDGNDKWRTSVERNKPFNERTTYGEWIKNMKGDRDNVSSKKE